MVSSHNLGIALFEKEEKLEKRENQMLNYSLGSGDRRLVSDNSVRDFIILCCYWMVVLRFNFWISHPMSSLAVTFMTQEINS